MVETRFGPTHLLVAGPPGDRPIVALQGGNVVNPLTLAWLGPLAGEFRIYAPDTIGQPARSAGRRVSANDTSFGEWALDVLDALELRSASLIGTSYGAGVFLRLAAIAPNRIDRGVLVVPAGLTEVPLGSMLSLAAGYLGYRFTGRLRLVEATVRSLAGPNPDALMVESTALAFRGTQLDTESDLRVHPGPVRGAGACRSPTGRGDHDPGSGGLSARCRAGHGRKPRRRPGPCDDDVEFAFGLDLTLDGLERVRAGG